MKIYRTTITKGGGAGVADQPTTLRVGDNEYRETNGEISTPLYVLTITANDTIFTPTLNGNVDLGDIGGANDGVLDILLNGSSVGDFSANLATNESINLNATTSITQNGLSSSVDGVGNIDIGNVVKLIRFLGSTIIPLSNGLASLPSPYTTIYGSIFGGLLGVNNAYTDFSQYTTPVGYITATTDEADNNVNNWAYLINWKGAYLNTILSLLEYNKTGNYTYTAKIRCEVFGEKDNVTLYPILYKYFTASDKDRVRLAMAITGLLWADKPINYGYSRTISSADSMLVGLDYYDGENSTYYPTNLITLNGISGAGVYIVEISVINNVVDSYVVTKLSSISVTANGTTYNESNGNIDIGSYCKTLVINNVTYNVSPTGEIDLGHISSMVGILYRGYEYRPNNYYLYGWKIVNDAAFRDCRLEIYRNNDRNNRNNSRLTINKNYVTSYIDKDFPAGVYLLVDRYGVFELYRLDYYYIYLISANPIGDYPYLVALSTAGNFITTLMEGQIYEYHPSISTYLHTIDSNYLNTYGILLQSGVHQLDFSNITLPI